MKLLLLLFALPLVAADFKAGFGRINITPTQPIYLSGYAARKKPSEGVLQKIWAKALAIEDAKGNRAVIVTTDLIGLPRAVADQVGAEVDKRYRLRRSQLVLNSSHTHSGPVVHGNLTSMFELTPDQRRAITDYTQALAIQLADVVGAALGDLQPARLDIGHGTGTFAINRRQATANGVKIGLNPTGPVNQDIPVIRVSGLNGQLRGVLFGYACHNTTLGADLFNVNGDYAGFAQAAFEAAHPNSTAMFLMLTGADANPNPRGTVALAEQHGNSLAKEVDRVLGGKLEALSGPLRSAFQMTELAFVPHTRETFETESKDPNWFKQQRAAAMLAAPSITRAQGGWPARPVRVIVPWPPGGSTDVLVRIYCELMQPILGQNFIIENRPGAGGNIGIDATAKATPDGYTMGIASVGHLVINNFLYARLPYDPARDLVPVGIAWDLPNVVVV
ncbi:MAG: neutral/alkaline non-lysosomal ceramidase N-terminal domain-containing protein, partial [Acidobacteria bacterium]|nr:neutral/alkaline non-lysosomal ceramidase N-terminal domain-containing protein [Acidobacteriota bacterium]